MKILYYDCFAGISGDMNLGAMIDLGMDPEYLTGELKKLNIGGYEISIKKDRRNGISGTRVDVLIFPEQDASDDRHAGHRRFTDIVKRIRECGLSENVKSISLNIFEKLAEAEAKVHGHSIEDVLFHEVGAVDSIVDIVGAAICFDHFKVDRVISSAVQTGGGFVRCAHGILPVPAPATAEILRGIPVKTSSAPFESTTPTGAAILAATVDRFTDQIRFTPTKTGYGIGQRNTEIPNVLRVFLGEIGGEAVADDVAREDAILMECNIDDMNPEMYDSILDAFFAGGAQDVFLTPVIMKKSRPAVKISVLCRAEEREAMEEVFWMQTSTFGLRAYPVSKAMLRKEYSRQSTPYGEISMKHAAFRGRRIKSKPEYEDCKKLAREKNIALKEIYEGLKSENVP
jgi:uncharacterized protein (TIGR00299 family) protein